MMTEITYTVLFGIPAVILVLALIAYKQTTRRLDAMDREISQLRSRTPNTR